MRHKVKKTFVSGSKAHRKSLLKNLAASLIVHESIYTTLTKSKALKSYVDKLITISKRTDLTQFNKIRMLNTKLYDELAVKKLIDVLSLKFKDRSSGYTSTLKVDTRKGDSAKLVKIYFVS